MASSTGRQRTEFEELVTHPNPSHGPELGPERGETSRHKAWHARALVDPVSQPHHGQGQAHSGEYTWNVRVFFFFFFFLGGGGGKSVEQYKQYKLRLRFLILTNLSKT